MAQNKIIFGPELARMLGLSEEQVSELARTGRLPFGVSSASPRRIFIDAGDWISWKCAAETMTNEQ